MINIFHHEFLPMIDSNLFISFCALSPITTVYSYCVMPVYSWEDATKSLQKVLSFLTLCVNSYLSIHSNWLALKCSQHHRAWFFRQQSCHRHCLCFFFIVFGIINSGWYFIASIHVLYPLCFFVCLNRCILLWSFVSWRSLCHDNLVSIWWTTSPACLIKLLSIIMKLYNA